MAEIIKGKKIDEVIADSLKEISDRKDGLKSKGLSSGWKTLDSCIGGGFQPRMSYLVAGMSGSAKSTIANIIETNIFDHNPKERENLMVLNFNFEMPSIMNLIKKYSSDTEKTVDQLMSVEEDLDEETFNKVVEKADRYKNYPIAYFEVAGNVRAVEDTVMAMHLKHPSKTLFCILDHTGLVMPKDGAQSDIKMIAELAQMSIRIKKQTNCIFLFLGQLNSEIESHERIVNASTQAPKARDLYGGKAIFHAMDYVFMAHRPELLGLAEYTARKLPCRDYLYFHIRKARYGKQATISFDCSRLGQNIIRELEVLN
jgi:replicative DNA helicase